MKRFLDLFSDKTVVYFATEDQKQPRVRPITLLKFDDKFYFVTFKDDKKVYQLINNANYEFCLELKENDCVGYVRCSGLVEFITEIQIKKMIFESFSFISNFFDSYENENFVLIKLDICSVNIMKPGEMEITEIKLQEEI